MLWGLKRFYGSGDLHFISCSCYRRQALLASERRRDLFLVVLEQVRQRYGFVALGYVTMPEHFHLLISEPEKGDPSVVTQALKSSGSPAESCPLAVRTTATKRSQRTFGSAGFTTTASAVFSSPAGRG
jgi:REP element-mobilizing transposase RayT